jgi:glycosyltransferase involved in cell wall biosynthesis
LNLRVLSTYKTYLPDPPGGLQEAIRQTCLSTSEHGIKNTIYTLSKQPYPRQVNFPEANVFREKSWLAPASCDIGSFKSLQTFKHLLSNTDVVHYYHPWPFADVLNLLSRSEKPQMMTYISDIVRQKYLDKFYMPLLRHSLDKMQIIVANCPTYAATSNVLSNPKIRDKVRVIPLGINESSYLTEGDESILDRRGIKNNFYFLFLGVLRYYKGLRFLIEAANLVKAKIVIAGSGPEQSKLQKQAIELGCNNIIFTGQVSEAEKIALLAHCSAFILPSHLRSEAYGMVLVEASMMGKPMISCEIGTGTSYINCHEETGFVVPPESSEALAVAMNAMLNENKLTHEMGIKARTRYERLFSGEALGKAYSDIYKELK